MEDWWLGYAIIHTVSSLSYRASHCCISFNKIQSSWPKIILLCLGILKKFVPYMMNKILTLCKHNELSKSTFWIWFSFPRRPTLGRELFLRKLVTFQRINQSHNNSISQWAEPEKMASFEPWLKNRFTWSKEWENKLVSCKSFKQRASLVIFFTIHRCLSKQKICWLVFPKILTAI